MPMQKRTVDATTNTRKVVSRSNSLYMMLLLIFIEYYLPNDEVGFVIRENDIKSAFH
jgi:hypothetical protein